jgi:hypothetical protein
VGNEEKSLTIIVFENQKVPTRGKLLTVVDMYKDIATTVRN